MNDFIESIKSIGFQERRPISSELLSYTYNDYSITINKVSNRWSMSRHALWKDISNQRNFSLDDIRLLEKYFKSEIRDNKLISIGI